MLLPIYVSLLGVPHVAMLAPLTLIYTLAIAFLMVSRLPVFSGKKVGKRVPPEMVLPIFILVVLFVALLISYPWEVLTIGTILYLGSLPFGVMSYRRYAAAEKATASAAGETDRPAETSEPVHRLPRTGAPDEMRPPRLN